MADNVTLNSGTGGDTIAADDVGGAKYQRIKIHFGADGTVNEVTSTATNPFPVALSDTDNAVLDTIDAVLDTINGKLVSGTVIGAVEINDASFAVADGNALGEGVLVQGDDGTDRKNIAVNATTGNVQVDLGTTDNAVLDDIAAQTSAASVHVDDAAFTLGTDSGVMVMGFAGTQSVDANDAAALACDTDGALHISDGGNSITIDGTVTADAGSGTFTVDLGANNDVTVTGPNSHDGTTLGNPVLNGARATNSIEGLTQVANADLTHLQADLNGVLLTRPYTTPEEILSERVSDTGGTSTAFTTFAAGGAGIHNYVTTISIYNSSATDGYVDFRDGTGGGIIFTAPAPATGGSVINLPVPLKGAANTALAYDVSESLSTVYISVVGYQAQG